MAMPISSMLGFNSGREAQQPRIASDFAFVVKTDPLGCK
jgi:hypothetical protein